MSLIRRPSILFALSVSIVACSAGDEEAEGPPPFGVGGTASLGAAGTASLGNGGTGAGGSANLGGVGSAQGGTTSTGGTGNAGGAGGTGPAAGGTGGVPSGAGGTANGAGGSANGAGGTGGANPDVNGGASAAFVCPAGPFGDPLQGMGQVQQLAAPQGSFFAFIEGPVWIASQNKLFFSDNASGPERIWQTSPPFTAATVFMPDSGSNGLAVDNEDQLLLADQADRRITRVNSANATVIGDVVPSGNFTPNDLILRSDDNLYFTDPNSGGRGFYRASPTGQVSGPFTQANAPNGPNAPNGVVLSPDENTLYVGDVQGRFISAFDLEADGAIDATSGRLFANTTGNTVDGMAVDCAGNVYAGTQTGVEVYSPAGMLLGIVPTGESSNATFGGADRRTLFVTSRAVLKSVTLGVPGLPD
ncbi:MAG: SMP-30/gluconolactonase/LRE family protein [Polyangiaceae bacterium]